MGDTNWTRRDLLRALTGLSLGGFACMPPPRPRRLETDPEPPKTGLPTLEPLIYQSNLQALMDTLWPATRDAEGQVLSPGALEVQAERVLRLDRFLLLAQAQGLLPGVSYDAVSDQAGFDEALSRFLELDLEALAQLQRPLTSFRELPLTHRERAIEAGYRDPVQAPLLTFVHAACVIAYYGAVYSDRGLVAIGFPEFEDLPDGLAVSGYPRTLSDGRVQDYTFNQSPMPTPGDPLEAVLDEGGDLR